MSACWAGAGGQSLNTHDGRRLHIVYPGMCPGGSGPDFRGAVLRNDDGSIERGDVELHLRAGDWIAHGHAGDARYNSVVLHVSADGANGRETVLENGRRVPTVCFPEPYASGVGSGLPCSGRAAVLPEAITHLLLCAGVERLMIRARAIVRRLQTEEPCRVLWLGAARVLGYSSNADAMELLSTHVAGHGFPRWMSLLSAMEREAFFLGAAGLLPSQRTSRHAAAVRDAVPWEREWAIAGAGRPLRAYSWRMNGVYPNNFPVRRVAALATLGPLLEDVTAFVRDRLREYRPSYRPPIEAIEQCFVVEGTPYWRGHYDFGLATRESRVVGYSKARELVINAVLPLLAAEAIAEGDDSFLNSLLHLYVRYPGTSANHVSRHMLRQLGYEGLRMSAAVCQGMLHTYTHYCSRGLCFACPLAAPVLSIESHRIPPAYENGVLDSN